MQIFAIINDEVEKNMSDIMTLGTNTNTETSQLDVAGITNRQYKDTLFRALFKDKKRLIELYNAIAGVNYPDDIDVKLCPVNPVMAMFNDLAFYVGSKLIVMCEHQSTINPNMPLRFLFYISDVLRAHALSKDTLKAMRLL